MEETEECFGFFIGPHISVAVATSRVALCYEETGKHLSQRAVTWGQCSLRHNLLGKNVSISQFVHSTVFFYLHKSKTTSSEYKYLANFADYFLLFQRFHHHFPMQISKMGITNRGMETQPLVYNRKMKK